MNCVRNKVDLTYLWGEAIASLQSMRLTTDSHSSVIIRGGQGLAVFLAHPDMGCFLIFFPENLPLRHSEPCNQTTQPTTQDLSISYSPSFTSKGFLSSNAFPCWAVPLCIVYSATLYSQGESDERQYLHWGNVGVSMMLNIMSVGLSLPYKP